METEKRKQGRPKGLPKTGGRQKGTPKTGGRQKGTPNKATTITRDIINDIANSLRPNIERDLAALDPRDRLQIFIKLIEFIVPKRTGIDMEISSSQAQPLIDKLLKLSEENE